MSEDHTEHVQEEIHEHAHGAKEKWIGWAALTAALFAALAAVGGSLASTNLTNSMRSQMGANDSWGYFQAKGIKASVLSTKEELLMVSSRRPTDDEYQKMEKKLADYASEQAGLKEQAEKQMELSEKHLEASETMELAVTLFHVAIAIAAVGVLTKVPWFWHGAMAIGVVGIGFLSVGYMHAPKPVVKAEAHETVAQHGAEGPGATAPAGHE